MICLFFTFMNALCTFCDTPFLLQATSLRKDMKRRGQNCSEHICHSLQVRATTLTSHLEGHRMRLYPQTCICTGLNSWLNQLFYSRWACLSFSHLNWSQKPAMGICFLWSNILSLKISTDGFHSRSLVHKQAMTFVGHPRVHHYAVGKVFRVVSTPTYESGFNFNTGIWDLIAHFIIWQNDNWFLKELVWFEVSFMSVALKVRGLFTSLTLSNNMFFFLNEGHMIRYPI